MYDATTDLVYAAALAAAVLTGATQADLDVVTDRGLHRREPTTRVAGTGRAPVAGAAGPVTAVTAATTTVIGVGELTLVVLHLVDPHHTPVLTGAPQLLGTWPGQDTPAVLVATQPDR